MRHAAIIVAIAACSPIDEAKDIGGDVADVTYCEVESCGTVFLCLLPDGGPSCKLSSAPCAEWCWIDDNAGELAGESGALSCVPTPRGGALGWPCIYGCESGHRDSNAYNGSFCPGG